MAIRSPLYHLKRIWKIINPQKTTDLCNKPCGNKRDLTEDAKEDITQMRKFSVAIEESPCIILITDQHGVIQYVNPSFTKITGYTSKQAIGKTPSILGSGVYPPEFHKNIWDTILSGEVWKGEIVNKNSSGELQWQYVKIAPIKDAEGNITNYLGIQEDISRQRYNELQVRIFQQAVEKSPVSIIVTDADGKITYVNPYFTELTEYAFEEVVGKNPNMLKGDRHNHEYYKCLWETISRGEIWKGDLCNVTKSGKEFWEHGIITPISSQGDKIDYYVAVKSDITDARKAEEALRDSEYRVKTILASMEQGFWMVDNNWQIIQVNLALCDMLGVSEKELVGKTIYNFLDYEYQKQIKAHINSWNPHSRSSFEMALLRPDRSLMPCLISPTPLFDQQNRQIGTFAMITDFTKRKEMERQIIEARDKAENASRVKSEFLSNMSHELKTPMHSILGFLELTLDDDQISLTQRNRISIAHSAATSLLSLLNDILDLSKIEQKQLLIEVTPFEIRKLIKEKLRPLAKKAQEKGLDLHYEVAPDLAKRYLGDPIRIGQILDNLVINAIKFTQNGTIRIKVEKYDREDTILFSISDTGIGIPHKHIDAVFEPFSQADTSATRSFGGTGVGAAISKQLVEMMGGKIWFASREQDGSVFYFTIKMVQISDLDENKDQKKMISEKKPSGLNILMADDLEENLLITELFLKKHSHRVTGVKNGLDAVREFQNGNFDVILMDVNMPEMDGIEATIRIRELEQGTGKAIPIIAITASAMDQEVDNYKRIGMNECISKPINFRELHILISKFVDDNKILESQLQGYLVSEDIFNGKGISITPLQSRGNLSTIEDAVEKKLQPEKISQNLQFSQKILNGVDIQRALDNWSTPAIFGDVLSKFYRDYRDIAQRVGSMVASQDDADGHIGEVRQITHALKGLSGNLSLSALFSIFTQMDRAALQNRMDLVLSLLPSLESEMEKVPLYIEAMSWVNSGKGDREIFKEGLTQRQKAADKSLAENTVLKGENSPSVNLSSQNLNTDNQRLMDLLSDLIAECEQYSPDALYPFLEELKYHISEAGLKPMFDKIDMFDFDGVRDAALALKQRLL